MQIAVLSDLHLGAKNALDRFHRAAEAEAGLLAALAHLERAVDRIVLLGDVFETLRGRRPGPSARELHAALDAYPRFARRLRTHPKYRLVFGNHDMIARDVLGAKEFHFEEDHGTKIAFFHGHQMDRLARGSAPFSRLGVWLGGILDRLGLPITERVDRFVHPTRDRPAGDPRTNERGALALARAFGAEIAVNGHTHQPTRVETRDGLYLNSGTWLAGRREYVLIETGSRRFDLCTADG